MSKFFKQLVKELDNENISIAADGSGSAEFSGFIDTGSYSLNAAFSGRFDGGIPNNKVTGFGGDPATGKTYFALGLLKTFLDSNDEAGGVIFDTESAITKDMMEQRGIDTARVIGMEPLTVQEFKTMALQTLEAYEKQSERPPMMFILDSLGQLSTTKEIADSSAGEDTKDMTRAASIKAAFRVLTLKLARLQVPLIFTNHVYTQVTTYGAPKDMGGGSGAKYAASQIAMLSKSKLRDGEDKAKVLGGIITVKMYKSRLTKENSEAEVKLTYDRGLDRYYGLFDLGKKHGIFVREGKQWKIGKQFASSEEEANENGEKYFTKDVLALLQPAVEKEYHYGK